MPGTLDDTKPAEQFEAIRLARLHYGPLPRESCNCPTCRRAKLDLEEATPNTDPHVPDADEDEI